MKQTESREYVLAIDNGTQSVRAIVFDLHGQIVAKSKVDIEPYYSDQPGWAEQDCDYLWQSLCEACNNLWQQIDFPKSCIKAASLTTQRGTLINLDAAGKPLRPAIIWADRRLAEGLSEIPFIYKFGFKLVGAKESVDSLRAEAECNWIAANQPEIWDKTAHFLLLSGFLTYRLTNRYVDSVGSQVGYLPFDYKKLDWAKKHNWRWNVLTAQRKQLPDLVAPGKLLGTITPEAAQQTGLPEGLPLIASGADKACEVIGCGCLQPEIGHLSFGTNATFNSLTQKYQEPILHAPPYPAAIPNYYNMEVGVHRGYWMVRWFKEQFGLNEQQQAKSLNTSEEVLFDKLLKEAPPGAMGLTLQPYWSPSVRYPGPEAKGAIIGFGDVHTRAHLYRAIIEGLAYALREGKERVENKTGNKVEALRISGGGSQSDEIMQITADIFGLPAERLHTYEASGLGAAISAAVGAGYYSDHQTAIQHMSHPGDTFTPNPDHVDLYEKLYREVYNPMYKKLQPLYSAIRRITGYPR